MCTFGLYGSIDVSALICRLVPCPPRDAEGSFGLVETDRYWNRSQVRQKRDQLCPLLNKLCSYNAKFFILRMSLKVVKGMRKDVNCSERIIRARSIDPIPE